MNLRDQLLASLSELPGTREFHIHVLVSSSRKRTDLFPYAQPRPRVYLQDILILLSEQTTPDSPRVLVTAIEASLYNVPATSCGVLYISKVDSTGHATRPSPTGSLVRGFIEYFCDPTTRPIRAEHFWVQLFARAQGQYLFPNSAGFAGKTPLGGIQLCAWWKRMLSGVATDLAAREKERMNIKLYYVLPGLSELEAIQSLKSPGAMSSITNSTDLVWTYGHPYSQTEIPLPCPPSSKKDQGRTNLGHFIPSFEDDPKSRFMDEIAHITEAGGVSSPKQKRRKTIGHGSSAGHASDSDDDDNAKLGEVNKVTPDEFWERLSFRQECISGVVTAFFAVGLSPRAKTTERPARTNTSTSTSTGTAPSPLAPQPGQVSPRMVRRVVATLLNHHDFSSTERAVRATETLEEAIKGLCEDLAPVPTSSMITVRHADRLSTPEPGPSRVTLDVPVTPPRRTGARQHVPDTSPNPFPEPVASLETYHSYIYGSVAVRNPLLPEKSEVRSGNSAVSSSGGAAAPPVTVLSVRKKRKAPS
ncbi:uncharacterized protein LAESUDRAFT_723085 [Laetiporus sulphureus 93-53]|uniref:histone acetyltransferase n=1 Tax=Laetiporus sulphureus 93-53 TaxID=1314785 RepID=A0A165FS93_9APHY|nr:uncharacterized protein LAESUDRAFT_723085 [Laetiporus sulphureus 93-53]KZT09345.1 hypothetical protein LAESUDRAFT_723085 [Laetiporus sulphureus 93-53]